MRIESAVFILKRIIHFTQEKNVAEKSDLKNSALVVTYNALEKHLNANMSKEYVEMLDEFGELFSFLMKQGRCIASQDLEIKWGYNVMRGSVYNKDVDTGRQRFPPLIRPYFYKYNLFILYQEPQVIQYHGTKEDYYEFTERLDSEIQACYKVNIYIYTYTLSIKIDLFAYSIFRKILYRKKNIESEKISKISLTIYLKTFLTNQNYRLN